MFIAVRDIVQISSMEIDDTFASRSGIMTGVAVDKVPKIRTTGGPYKIRLRKKLAHLFG
jgi:hypothetical protein